MMIFVFVSIVLSLYSCNAIHGKILEQATAEFCFTNDLLKNCTQDTNSFYLNGTCYRTGKCCKTQPEATNSCKADGMQLAVVRCADVAAQFLNCYSNYVDDTIEELSEEIYIHIGSPNSNTSSLYNILDGTETSDGDILSVKPIQPGDCSGLVYKESFFTIRTFPCDQPMMYFCEIGPSFQQIGCDQVLDGRKFPVVQNITADTAHDCIDYCAISSSCTGVNYSPTSKLCKILSEDSSSSFLYNVGCVTNVTKYRFFALFLINVYIFRL